ncbi:MAG TPA: DUF5615 family PIN-like protein [Bacteroidales bacterium]|nr:DUF5615 family PIN-like protein [Bacteroidales bacterium]
MKFIVDAQLPKSLSDFLKEKGFDSIHTLELPDKNRTGDKIINEISKEQERIVISKDLDFLESYLVKSEPERLVLVKTGNIPNKYLLEIFSKNLNLIVEMLKRSKLVEISKTDIAEHE